MSALRWYCCRLGSGMPFLAGWSTVLLAGRPGNPRAASTIKHREIALCSQSARVVRRHYWPITRSSLPSPSLFQDVHAPLSIMESDRGLDTALYHWRTWRHNDAGWRHCGDGNGAGVEGNDGEGASDNGQGLSG